MSRVITAPILTHEQVAVDPAIVRDLGAAAQAAGGLWRLLFGQRADRPIEIEIGCGRGGFLLRCAQERPQHNLLGIEWANELYRHVVDRMVRRGVPNVRVMRCDARRFIVSECPRESLHALHIYHPDPWPKRRHHKRRLFQPEFVSAAVACLRNRGRIAVQTDHAEYFGWIRPMLLERAELEGVPFDDPEFSVTGELVQTNFEIKYRREGRAIYQLAARRR